MDCIVDIEHLYKHYSDKTVLSDIQLKIPRGSIFGLLGPNGAGKTSLIRILNGITMPDSGSYNIYTNSKDVNKQQIGYLPEERGLYKKMSVWDQLLYLARLKGMTQIEAKIGIEYWLQKMDIESWKDKKIEDLSKGMQQKIQFISTIINNPELLILDEPFSGFDPINANLIKQEIIELKEKGHTIVLSTHNMSSVEELCENIALIDKGKIVLQGNVQEIKKQYSENIYEFIFNGSEPAFSNGLWSAGQILSFSKIGENSKAIVTLNTRFTLNNLLKNMLDSVKLLGFKEVLPSMNDIFIKTVTQNNNDAK